MASCPEAGEKVFVWSIHPKNEGIRMAIAFGRETFEDWGGMPIVPAAWRPRGKPASLAEPPCFGAFDGEDERPAFFTVSPFETSRVCTSQAEGGCWADVGEPAQLEDITPIVVRTRQEADAWFPVMEKACRLLNHECGLRDLSSVLATYQYRARISAGYPERDRIPTYE